MVEAGSKVWESHYCQLAAQVRARRANITTGAAAATGVFVSAVKGRRGERYPRSWRPQ